MGNNEKVRSLEREVTQLQSDINRLMMEHSDAVRDASESHRRQMDLQHMIDVCNASNRQLTMELDSVRMSKEREIGNITATLQAESGGAEWN